MNRAVWRRGFRVVLYFGLVAFAHAEGVAWASELSQEDLLTLIQLRIGDDAIVAKMKKDGIGFPVDEQAIARLKDAGASADIIGAVQDLAKSKPTPRENEVTFQDVIKLLSLGIEEDAILKRLAKSPTTFVLSDQQVAELKKAGASDTVIAALQSVRAASPQAAELITDIAIILDCSGSMRESTSDGQTKMGVAKTVVADLVQKIPEGLNVTFVIYGHEVFGGADDPRNCQAVKVARPLGRLDAAAKSELTAGIAELKPTGATPIALSLRVAGQELAKHDAYCGVVLITDGLETCKGDPVAEAAALAKNPKLTFGVNVVGFDIKEDERKSLKGIADAGKGKYYNAASARELSDAIGAIAKEIQVVAKPPERVETSRRAVKILQPTVEMPEMAEVVLVKTDGPIKEARLYKLGSIAKYGEEVRIPSATAKYDLVWYPKEGEGILLVKGLSLPERKVVEIRPEDHLGLIQVNGEGTPKNIYVTAKDQPKVFTFSTQRAKRFGDVMVVPVGTYNVLVDDSLIEEDLEVVPGKLYTLE